MSEIDFDGDTDTVWDSYLLDRLVDPDGLNDGDGRAPSAAGLYLVDEDGEEVLGAALSIRDADNYDDATDMFETDVAALFAVAEDDATGAVVNVGGVDYEVAKRDAVDVGGDGAVPFTYLRAETSGIVLAALPDMVVAGYYDEDRKNTVEATAEAVAACARALRVDLSL
ncbi:hypothetical protein OG357_33885 [Streptomyces sp. NBC_01255]|uniref:hypothetical protein n=1 Tax=Streptomyces sp. NBC_01255 TaxID=2903798 RepID=UPI002E353346|nr:hypothetical protein [Streptomyces sp. NBC_01255]